MDTRSSEIFRRPLVPATKYTSLANTYYHRSPCQGTRALNPKDAEYIQSVTKRFVGIRKIVNVTLTMLQVLSGFKWHRCGVRLYTAHVRALSWESSGRITASRHMELRSCSKILKWWLTVFSSAGLNSAHSLSKSIRERCRTSINGSIRTAYITCTCVFELATRLSVSISVAEVYLS